MKRQKLQSIVGRIAGTLFLLVLFTMFSCTDERENKYAEEAEPIEFGLVETRATDATFENGDKIGIYAVESGTTFVESGNHADNRQYSYQDGKFQPVTPADCIFKVKGKSYNYYAYYPYRSNITPGNVEFDAVGTTTRKRPLWSMNNAGSGSSIQFTFSNVFGLVEVNVNETADRIVSGTVLGKLSKVSMNLCENMLTTLRHSPVSVPLTLYNSSGSVATFRAFLPGGNVISAGDELFTFKTASSESKRFYATRDITTVAGEKNVFSLTHLEEYLIKATSTAGGTITSDATAWATGKKFKDGQQCSIPFAANAGYFFDGIYENNIKQDCTVSPYVFTVTKARTLEVRFREDVITWEYSFSVSPTFLKFTSKGETKAFTVTSKKTKIINGVSTGVQEDATYTTRISGADAGAFSVSGQSVVASENPATVIRNGTLTITQSGSGKSATIMLRQDEKIDIGTEV